MLLASLEQCWGLSSGAAISQAVPASCIITALVKGMLWLTTVLGPLEGPGAVVCLSQQACGMFWVSYSDCNNTFSSAWCPCMCSTAFFHTCRKLRGEACALMWALMDHNVQLMEDLTHANLEAPGGPPRPPGANMQQALLVSPPAPHCGLPQQNAALPGCVTFPRGAGHQQDAGHACTCGLNTTSAVLVRPILERGSISESV